MLSAGLVYWTEAEKEIRILCLMFEPGDSVEYVTKTLDTGNLLSYEMEEDQLYVRSFYNLYSSGCMVTYSATEIVTERSYSKYFDLTAFLIWPSLIISVGLMAFQILLALGYPFGEYAWGGTHDVLPKKLRFGSLASALILSGSILLLSGYTFEFLRLPEAYPIYGVLFLMSVFANFNSNSVKEKRLGVPMALLLYTTFLLISIQ